MVLSAKSKRRLTKLIEFMEGLPASANKHFNMGTWFAHNGGDDHRFKIGKELPPDAIHECGTTACALGWAATMPAFRRIGLRVIWNDDVDGTELKLGKARDWNAVQELFDVDFFYATSLFEMRKSDTTPKKWAKRARRLMREWDKAHV